MFARIVQQLSTRVAARHADFKPMVPPPEGWRGEPWLHPGNLDEYVAGIRQFIPRMQVLSWLLAAVTITLCALFPGLVRDHYIIAIILHTLLSTAISRPWLKHRRRYLGPQRIVVADAERRAMYLNMIPQFIGFGGAAAIVFRMPMLAVLAVLSIIGFYLFMVRLGFYFYGGLIDHAQCARCRYDVSHCPAEEPCPECGGDLRNTPERQGATRIERPPKRRLAIPAIALPVIIILFMLTRLVSFTAPIAPILPTSALLLIAPFDSGVLRTLDQRNITQNQRSEIAQQLLRQARSNPGFRSFGTLAWIDDQVIARRINQSVIDEYHTGVTKVSVDAPDTALHGEVVRVTVRAETDGLGINFNRSHTSSKHALFLNTLHVDGAQSSTFTSITPKADDRAAFTYAYSSKHAKGRALGPEHDTRRFAEFTATEPGTLTLSFDVVVIATSNFQERITWHDDNTYTITPEPLWHEKRTLTHTIEVRPAP